MTMIPERRRLPRALVPVLALLGISVFINYIDRGNLSIAAPLLKDELSITPQRLGFLLSAFFYTYALLQPIYGWLADRLNVYWLLAFCFCLWSLATASTGLVKTFVALFLMRLAVGVGESVSYPAYSKIIALNFQEEHRGIANGCIATGLSFGPGFGILLGGMLMSRFGWRPFFIGLGLISLLWLPLWIMLAPSANTAPPASAAHEFSFRRFIKLRDAWAACLHLFCSNYVNYFLLTWLPYYLTRELDYSLQTMAEIGGLAYFIGGLSAIGAGWLSDRLIARGGSPTKIRKAFAGAALAANGVMLGLCCITGGRLSVAIILCSMVFFGCTASNQFAIAQRLAGPQAIGRWMGFQNAFGNFAGISAATITGYVVGRTGHFGLAFLAVMAVSLVGTAIMYLLMGPVEPVAWAGKARSISAHIIK